METKMENLILIRPATFKDAPQIAHVHTQSWIEIYTGRIHQEVLDQLTLERRLKQWQTRLVQDTRDVLVLELDGEVVAFSQAVHVPEATLGTDAELQAIYALQKHQGKGLGKKLLLESVKKLHSAGAKSLGLWVLRDNPTIGFYQHMGGRQQGETSTRWFGHDLPVLGYVWDDMGVLLKS